MALTLLFVLYAFNIQLQGAYSAMVETNKARFARFLPLEGWNITRSVISTAKKDAPSDCASSCVSLGTCDSFFFNTATGECQYHHVIFNTTAGAEDQEGLQYYYITNGWCSFDKGFQLLTEDGPCVKFHTDKKTWYDANQTCVSYSPSSRLVVLDNQEKNELVKTAAKATSGRPWIGLWEENPQLEDEYLWVDEGNVTFSDWKGGRSWSSPDAQDCVCLYRAGHLQWARLPCISKELYICESNKPI